jgi:tetratricopeptide (TPR) repeat protein
VHAQTQERVSAQVRSALTPGELEAWTAWQEDRLITVRRLAEALVREDRSSFVGHFLLGMALRQGDGRLPQALWHLARARQAYETRWKVAPAPPGAPWQIHREILYAIIEVAQELDRPLWRLEMIDWYDAIYQPDLHAQRAWTLLALGRVDEARAAADQATQAADRTDRALGYNARCAIETEAGTPTARLDACRQAFDDAVDRASRETATDPVYGVNIAVHGVNAAQAALAAQEPQLAESIAREASGRLAWTPANPWRLLTRLMVAQARSTDAVVALTEMDRWRRRQPPWLRDAARADTEAVLAEALLVAGRTQEALRAIDRALDRPDRRGLTTSTAAQAMGSHALLRLVIARTHLQRQREIAAAWDLAGRIPPWTRLANAWNRWSDVERVRSAVGDGRLEATLQPWGARGLDIPPWLALELVDVLGPGVVQAALRRAAAGAESERWAGHQAAYRARIALARGRTAEAAREIERVEAVLGTEESLLRAGLHARLGHALWRQRRSEQALPHLLQAMQLDPGALRRAEVPLPAAIERLDASALTAALERRLRRSPRLARARGAFRVTLAEVGSTAVELCLYGPGNEHLGCSETVRSQTEGVDEPREEWLVRAVDDFHTQRFAMVLQVDSVSLSTLDGTTTGSAVDARERVQQALDALLQQDAPGPPPAPELPSQPGLAPAPAPRPPKPPAQPRGLW